MRYCLRVATRIVLAVGLASGASAQLSGSYAIDPAGSGPNNFTTFRAATTALGAGVSGPVTFAVASTTFKEAIVLTPISGTSPANTVSFVARGLPAIIDANGRAEALALLGNCRYLAFENIELKNASRCGLFIVRRLNSALRASFCSFKRITCDGPMPGSSPTYAIRNEYGDDMLFEDCVFRGGGVTAHSEQQNRCVYRNCEFDGKGRAAALLDPYNSNDADNLFENCFFHDCSPSGRGLNIDKGQFGGMFWHNTIIVTTSESAVHLGAFRYWNTANSFGNNIVINKGTGVCIRYGWDTTNNVLWANDADYNCYYAPNGMACELEGGFGFSKGALAQWQAYFNANRAALVLQTGNPPIPTPAQVRFDDNSIEADPMLVSDSAPYDIRLTGASPCIDAGTTNYVAGPWITYNPAYATATDFKGEPRPTMFVDIGADEVGVRLFGGGSARPGTQITYTLIAPADANRPYQMGTSLGNGPLPLDTRRLGLSLDTLLVDSVSGTLPGVFANYVGLLDGSGNGTAALNVPNIPALVGIRLYSAFLTLNPSAPSGVSNISNTFDFTVQP